MFKIDDTTYAVRNGSFGYVSFKAPASLPALVQRIAELRAEGTPYHDIDAQLLSTDGSREQSTSYNIMRTSAARRMLAETA